MAEDRLFRMYKSEVCKLFKRFAQDVYIYLRSSKVAGENFDPIRNVGYDITQRNPIAVKAWVRQPSPDGKLLGQIGVVGSEPKELIIFGKDLNTVIEAERVVINNKDYHVYNDAVGTRVAKLERIYDLVRIVLWLKEGDN